MLVSLEDSDLKPPATLIQRFGVSLDLGLRVLAWVQTVRAGYDFQHERIVRDRTRHGAEVIEGEFDRHGSRVWDNPHVGFMPTMPQ